MKKKLSISYTSLDNLYHEIIHSYTEPICFSPYKWVKEDSMQIYKTHTHYRHSLKKELLPLACYPVKRTQCVIFFISKFR